MTMIDVTTLTDAALEGMLGIPGLAFTAHNELVRRRTPAPTSWCETCGQPVMNNVCVCWVHLADDLQRYLGYEHDGAAEQAKIMWDNLGPIDRERVWSAEYAETHDVETYPQEHDYKPSLDDRAYADGERAYADDDAGTREFHDYKPITPQEATDTKTDALGFPWSAYEAATNKPTKRVLWLVTYGDFYEPSTIAGVFTTKAKADAVAAGKYLSRYDCLSVEEITVDETIRPLYMD